MNGFRPWRRTARFPPSRGSSFFVDSIGDAVGQEPVEPQRRFTESLTFAIALATAVGVAGLFGLLQLLPVTGS